VPWGNRQSNRISLARGFPVQMMGIDGTWRRDCVMLDVSDTGARLRVAGSIEGLNLKEFFLLLSGTGLAYRRCELIRVNGEEIGIRFLSKAAEKQQRTQGAR